MTDLPDQWCTYVRLQDKLSRRQQVDDYAWGIESGLNRLLTEERLSAEEVDRAIRSESRKERYQNQLRRVHLAVGESAGNPENVWDARRRLRLVKARVSAEELALLNALGEGRRYKEIAAEQKIDPGALRARVLRLRRTLVALAS